MQARTLEPPTRDSGPLARITWLGGYRPVQGLGTIHGKPFYFRASGDCWTFAVSATKDGDPTRVSFQRTAGDYFYKERYGRRGQDHASFMPHPLACVYIQRAARYYLRSRKDK